MHKITSLTIVLLFSLYSLSSPRYANAAERLVIYNWSDYLPKNILETFTEETGIEVDYRVYNSNEEMYNTLTSKAGNGIDLIVPSAYMVSKMQRDGLLQSIDFKRLHNLQNLAPNLLNKAYDLGNKFSIPYLWGSVGIAINSDYVDARKIHQWQDLWLSDWKNSIVIQDDMRSFFQVALNAKGYSANTRDPMQLKSAHKKLHQLLPNIASFHEETIYKALLKKKTPIGVVWNGDAFLAQQENPAITYIYPAEGTSFWIDSFAIPINAKHANEAHCFINFMLRPKIAAQTVKELGYATPNTAALAFLEEDLRTNPIIFPPESVIMKGVFEENHGEKTASQMQHYWQELKNNHAKNSKNNMAKKREK